MDIQKFSIFLRAVDLGNLTLAAAEAGYTQSGVSQIIKKLEGEFGFPLLYRMHDGVRPTENAKEIIPVLRDIVNAANQLHQTAAAIRGMEIGELRIGSLSSISVHWLPHIFKDFQRKHPNISVKLTEGGDHELLSLLEEGRVDVVLSCNTNLRAFDWITLQEDPLLAVVPENHELATWSEVPLAAFCDLPFVTAPANIHYETHRLFQKHGIPLRIQYTTTDDYTTIAFIEQGLGVTVLPELLMRGYQHCRVKTIELSPRSPRAVGIVVPSLKNAPPAVKLFIDDVQAFVQNLKEE